MLKTFKKNYCHTSGNVAQSRKYDKGATKEQPPGKIHIKKRGKSQGKTTEYLFRPP